MDGILGTLSYVIAAFAAMFIVANQLPKRKYFILRAIIGCVAICAIRYGLKEWTDMFTFKSSFLRYTIISTAYLLVFILCALSVRLSFDCNVWAVLFCATTGYCMQYTTRKIYELLPLIFHFEPTKWLETLIVAGITAVFYFLAWYFLFRKNNYKGMLNEYKPQIVISIVVAVLTLYLNTYVSFGLRNLGNIEMEIYVYLFSIIAVVIAFWMECGVLNRNNMANEKEVLKQLLNQEREQFLREKQNIDLINIKCHDIRHQLRDMGDRVSPEVLKEITSAINIYDSKAETGNEAISVVFAKYGLYCAKNDIRLTYMLDGGKLDFIPSHELYALFGNAIENAVHAVEKLDKEKRNISVAEQCYGNMMNISISNYFDGKIEYDGKLPTNRAENHGYGVKSIKMIAEQYGGRINVDIQNDLFILNIFLPLPISPK
jgi:hypothetical protein